MQLPTQLKVGKTTYSVYLHHKPNAKKLGWCSYDTKIIEINTATSPANMRETLWHEVTHAILKDMQHPQYNDEVFVTAFSNRLSKAIDSARF